MRMHVCTCTPIAAHTYLLALLHILIIDGFTEARRYIAHRTSPQHSRQMFAVLKSVRLRRRRRHVVVIGVFTTTDLLLNGRIAVRIAFVL